MCQFCESHPNSKPAAGRLQLPSASGAHRRVEAEQVLRSRAFLPAHPTGQAAPAVLNGLVPAVGLDVVRAAPLNGLEGRRESGGLAHQGFAPSVASEIAPASIRNVGHKPPDAADGLVPGIGVIGSYTRSRKLRLITAGAWRGHAWQNHDSCKEISAAPASTCTEEMSQRQRRLVLCWPRDHGGFLAGAVTTHHQRIHERTIQTSR